MLEFHDKIGLILHGINTHPQQESWKIIYKNTITTVIIQSFREH